MIYISMLRGINVSGKNSVKMDRLRALFEDLGLKAVQTYIQSGNVIFESKAVSTGVLTKRVETAIFKEFGFAVPVVIRTSMQLSKILKANPFLIDSKVEVEKLHVTFLASAAKKTGLAKLSELPAKPDQFHASASKEEIYLHCPSGYGRTKLSNTALEKILGVGATTRNWNTVNRLVEMCLICNT